MAVDRVKAPPSPKRARADRVTALQSKGSKRTPAEVSEMLDLLLEMIRDLEARQQV